MEAVINAKATSTKHRGVYMPTLVEASINFTLALDGHGIYGSFPCSRVSTSSKTSLTIHMDNEHMARKQFLRQISCMGVKY
jgi:hypothetical protein